MSVQSSDACATPRATSRTERAVKAMAAELLPMGERDDRGDNRAHCNPCNLRMNLVKMGETGHTCSPCNLRMNLVKLRFKQLAFNRITSLFSHPTGQLHEQS